ncbi:MAG TPA: hypothetical protein DCQ31_14765, partial [Bacteroidales bacterium]|nr:hypothetical protein [Bacteroidales bacterium]
YIESIQSVHDKVNFGTLMHRLFSKIENPDEIDFVIHEMVFAGLISEEEMPEIKTKVSEVLKNPVVAAWFSAEYEAITEAGILTKAGATRIPDRIIIKDNKATVIDFKFGKPEPEHTLQVLEYMQLTRELGYESVSGILYYAETDSVVEVHD